MDINIDLDLGNLWDMLSAIGTIATVIVALYLANKRDKSPLRIYSVNCEETYYGEYGRHGNVEIINRVKKQGAIELQVRGRIEIYNPADDPKTLTNLKIKSQFGENTSHVLTNPILSEEKQSISVSPKQTKIIDFLINHKIKDANFSEEIFYEVKKHMLLGTDENRDIR